MKITKIEKKTGTRYTVDVDGGYFYILDEEIIQQNHLKVGKTVDQQFLADLMRQAEQRKARERAFYLLSYRDHSAKELYDKLCQNVSEEIAAATVAKMQELGLLNDEAYAQKLADYYLNRKLWGYRKCVFELQRKGIPREMAEQALADCRVDPRDQLYELFDRKYWRNLDGTPKGRKKVIDALMRQGYQYSDIRSAISDYEAENGIEKEEEEWQYE